MNDRPADSDSSPPSPGPNDRPNQFAAELGETVPAGAPRHPALELAGPPGPAADEAEYEDFGPPRRWTIRPAVLFVLTCLSTFWAGSTGFMPFEVLSESFNEGSLQLMRQSIVAHWDTGLVYMCCVLAILIAHEMGHFITSHYYRVYASYPFFIPMPSPIGTLGAVISMDGSSANRRQLFDIGIAGPLAGLVIAVPVLWIGVAGLDLQAGRPGIYALGLPPIAKLFLAFSHPEALAQGSGVVVQSTQLNPYFMAGWVGMFVTGLNMMPLSQLDGGHVLYGLSPRHAKKIARGLLLAAIIFSVMWDVWAHWSLMLFLVTLLGVDHPPTSDDRVSLGWPRTILGLVSWLIPLLCFPVDAIIYQGP